MNVLSDTGNLAALVQGTYVTDLSIVIVSWNAKKYLEECLTSLHGLDEGPSLEILVVDNASSDGSPEMVRNQFPDVKLIETGANLGFSRANNLAIELATGKYVCLINSDVNVPSDCLAKMYRYMEKEPTIGLLGPKMIGVDGRAHRSGMRFPSIWNAFVRALALDSIFKGTGIFGGSLMADFQFDRTRDVDVLNGWFWMVRREALNQVGLLDERFFIYGEDIDWCKRFHLAGWRVVFYSEAEALHYGGASSANAPLRFSLEKQRANLQYWEKYRGRTAVFCCLMGVWLHQVIRAAGWWLVYLTRRSLRSRADFEIAQSAACLRWVLNSRNVKGRGQR